MNTSIEPGRCRHFKDREYTVIGVAQHSETGESFVVYRPEYGERTLRVRPLAMWSEHVERDSYSSPRFFKIPDRPCNSPLCDFGNPPAMSGGSLCSVCYERSFDR